MSEVSVVMPSLNEEGTIGRCIEKVKGVFNENHIDGEIIVADNSTDKTAEIAKSLGATVITPEKRGYGNAYLAGLSYAKGDCHRSYATAARAGIGNKSAVYVDKRRFWLVIRDRKCSYCHAARGDRYTDDIHGDISKCVIAGGRR